MITIRCFGERDLSHQSIGYLSAEKLLFLSPWRPVELDTTSLDGEEWVCPNCAATRTFFPSLARLEGSSRQLMIQCPMCDHLIVVQIDFDDPGTITARYGGPHVDRFLRFLDERRMAEGD